MLVAPSCYECLERLVCQTARLAAHLPDQELEAKSAGLEVLKRRYSDRAVSTRIASEAHRVIRQVTDNPDPFEEMKKREIRLASAVFARADKEDGDLGAVARLAVHGNALDFFVDHETLVASLSQPVFLAIDDLGRLGRKLRESRNILYLADNAGECFFDSPLVHYLGARAKTTYVVKGSPVQNDITLKELRMANLERAMGEVATTGNDFVGLDLETASPDFIRAFDSAELIIAKGMGYYETISEMKPEGRVVFMLKAKCRPVADSLGVALNSCVVKVY